MPLNQIVRTRYVLSGGKTTSANLFHGQLNGVELALIPWVTDVRYEPQIPTITTMTLKSHVVEYANKNRVGDLIMSGDIGPKIYGMTEEALSYTMFKALSDLIAAGLESNQPEFTLYMFDEGINYRVVPIKLAFLRQQRNKVGLRYELAFKLFDTVTDGVVLVEPAIEALKVDKNKTWLENAVSRIDAAMAVINSATEAIADTNQTVIGYINTIAVTYDSVVKTVFGAVLLPARLLASLRGAINQIVDTTYDMLYAAEATAALYGPADDDYNVTQHEPVPGVDTDYKVMIKVVNNQLEQAYAALVSFQAAANEAYGRSDVWVIGEGETLWSIAGQSIGDADRWEELAVLNDLVPPYIDHKGGAGIARVGDTLRLPTVLNASVVSLGSAEDDAETVAYGKDLRLIEGDLALRTEYKTVGGNTFVIVDFCDIAGEACFTQNLDTRIRTVAGTNALFQGRGIPAAVGMADTLEREAAFLVAVQSELQSDDRVATVRNLAVRVNGNYWDWEGTVVLRNATEILTGGQA